MLRGNYNLNYRLIRVYSVFVITLFSTLSLGQIPDRAFQITDSICNSHGVCDNYKPVLLDSNQFYIDSNTQMYAFSYEVQFREDLKTIVRISFLDDFTKQRVSGFPDENYPLAICDILTREYLWQAAKKNGLNTRFKKCDYTLVFYQDKIVIRFHEDHSRSKKFSDKDFYEVDAMTGVFIRHEVITFLF